MLHSDLGILDRCRLTQPMALLSVILHLLQVLLLLSVNGVRSCLVDLAEVDTAAALAAASAVLLLLLLACGALQRVLAREAALLIRRVITRSRAHCRARGRGFILSGFPEC